MNLGEKMFRILSVLTLTVGAVVAIAGAKPHDVAEISQEIQLMIADAESANEVNRINQGQWEYGQKNQKPGRLVLTQIQAKSP